MIAAALREKAAQSRLPSGFTDRLLASVRSLGAYAPRLRFPVRKAAAIWLALGLGALAATLVVSQAVFDGNAETGGPRPVAAAIGDSSTNEQGEDNMIMARKVAALAGAAVLTVSAPAAKLSSEPTFVFLRPETSSFWNTATNSTMTLPIDYPRGATKATLTVSGAGYAAKTYPNITGSSFDLELPVPDSPQNENVYDLTLTFDDGTVRTAKLGLIQGLSPDSEGSTRCLAPAEGDVWNTIKKRAVLPIPYGTESFTMSVNGGTVTDVDTGLNGAQGWYAFRPATGDSVSLSLMVGGINYAATLLGKGDGYFVIIR
jgi:hypothetical protein